MGIFSDDIVRDILARVVRAAQGGEGGFTDAMAEQIERQVREDWGTTRPYIAAAKVDKLAERNDKIGQLWDAGERDIRGLATRFGLSCKQVRRIVGR